MYKYNMKDNFYRIMNSDGKTVKVLETLEQFADYVKSLAEAPISTKPQSSSPIAAAIAKVPTVAIGKDAQLVSGEPPQKPRTILRRAGERPQVKDHQSDSVLVLKRLLSSRDG
jgi:hypothetical protein